MNMQYQSSYRPRPTPPSRHRRRWPLVCLMLLTVWGIWTLGRYISFPKDLVSAITASHKQATAPSSLADSNLASSVDAAIKANPQLDMSVALIDTDNDQSLNFGKTTSFVGASTTKVITAVCYLHEVEEGQASLDDQIGDYDAQFQIQEMINQSSNDSWQLLVNAIGLQQLGSYAHSIGLNSYDTDDNSLTAADEAHLLAQLSEGKLLNQTDTHLLLSYMQNTNDDDLIPGAVPSNVTVYHKYGLLDGNLHDAAILTKNGHTVVLVIYTNNPSNNTDDYSQRETVFHQLTKAVLQYT